ncbi:NAD-dependent epimerase/dehydratase family protein [Agromyces silvae]|uniref:NAD-dependent epimerase/dehydratase family protein n=1 Tax=Agromyces silvae TaxID=3388266 RepID=UPI00359F7619
MPHLRDHELTVLDVTTAGRLDGAEFRQGSALDETTVERAIEGRDAVIHLAAVVPKGAAMHDESKVRAAFDVNVRSVYLALQRARAAGVRSFVHVSSMSVYAQYGVIPIDPHSSPDALTPYGLTKRLGEQTCAAFAAADTNLTITSLRLAVPTTEDLWPLWRSPSTPDAEPTAPTMADGRTVAALHPSDLAAAVEWALIRRGAYTAIPVAGDVDGETFLRPAGWRPRMGATGR